MTPNVPNAFTIEICGNIEALMPALDAIDIFAGRHRVVRDDRLALKLCMEEILANAILHGHAIDSTHAIRMDVALYGPELHLKIEDEGTPFNPLEAPDPDLSLPADERPVGGLGVFLVRKMMDAVAYRRAEGKNVLTLVKKIRTEPPAA